MQTPPVRRSGSGSISLALIAAMALLALALLALALSSEPAATRVLGVTGGLTAALTSAWLLRTQTAAQRRQEAASRRTRLLTDSAAELAKATSLEEALHGLPPMIMRILEIDHASVLLPQPSGELRLAQAIPALHPTRVVPERSISARAVRSGMVQVVADSRKDPEYYAYDAANREPSEGPPAARGNIALPLRSDGDVFAVINVERSIDRPFDDEDVDSLVALARIVEANAGRLEARRIQIKRERTARLLANLAVELSLVSEPAEAMKRAVDTLLAELDLTGGCGIEFERGAFRLVEGSEVLPTHLLELLRNGLPWNTGDLPRVWSGGEPYIQSDLLTTTNPLILAHRLQAIAILPVPDEFGETIALLAVGRPDARHDWNEDVRAVLRGVSTNLGLALGRLSTRVRERRLLEVVRQLASSDDVAELYDQVARTATEIVPGAEAASLLVYDGDQGFTFEAAVGYNLAELRATGPLSEASQRGWHGGGPEAWRSGRPRLLSGANVAALSTVLASPESREILRRAGRIGEVVSNLSTPVSAGGEVIAVLNLDAFSHSGAFGHRSLQLAQLLGQHIAVIVRRAQDRLALARMARTDPLTQLGNRSAFNEALERAIHRATSEGATLGLAIFDLNGFKAINDRFGHPTGDRILKRAATAMSAAIGEHDELFRWGGDEFALLLPASEEASVPARIEAALNALQSLELERLNLSASVGYASYPLEATTSDALIRLADARMYRLKRVPLDRQDG